MGKKRSYEGRDITVVFEAGRCIHAAAYVRGAPAVFDADARPWINPESAGAAAELAAVIERCPTGALSYTRGDGVAEAGDAEASFTVAPDGPVHARGRLILKHPDGQLESLTRAALCRCGQSATKPFCDNSHIKAGFKAEGTLGASSVRPDDTDTDEAVGLRTRPDGPVVIEGACAIRSADGATIHRGGQAALCRCGGSSRKPYCDGSHKRNGFRAP